MKTISYEKPTGSRFQDLTGVKSRNWEVIEFAFIRNGQTYWKCKCICSTEQNITARRIKDESYESCGCIRVKNSKDRGWLHPAYWVLSNMMTRCYNKKFRSYVDYGGRGISVCEEWRTSPQIFIEWAESTNYQEGLTIERIDVNGNYEPNNCKWIIAGRQQWNRTKSVLNPIKVRIAISLRSNFGISCTEIGQLLGGVKKSTIQKTLSHRAKNWQEVSGLSIHELIEQNIIG